MQIPGQEGNNHWVDSDRVHVGWWLIDLTTAEAEARQRQFLHVLLLWDLAVTE